MRSHNRMFLAAGMTAAALGGAALAFHRWVTRRAAGQWFDAEGVRLFFTEDGQGEPVLLLHGFAAHADVNWRRPGVIPALIPYFRVLALDLRGHGLSDKPHEPAAYGLEFARDVIRLLDYFGIPRVRLAGYSLGGFIALKAATLNPDRIRSLAVMGAGWESPDQPGLLAAMPHIQRALLTGRPLKPLSAYLEGERHAPGLLNTLWVNVMVRFYNDPQALAAVVASLPELAVTESDVRALPMPVLALAGDKDPLRLSTEALAARAPHCERVIIPGADHLTTLMQPQTKQALRDFFLSHDHS